MRNILHKYETERVAVAESFITMEPELRDIVKSRNTQKGDALEIARVAAVMGAKKTWEIIPFCHQIPITQVDVEYAFEDDGIRVTVTCGCIGTTGVEMEAMTAASICTLTLYDMLKPYDATCEIRHTKLLSKRGGKSDFALRLDTPVDVAVVTVSDLVSNGEKGDRAGDAVRSALSGNETRVRLSVVVPCESDAIREAVRACLDAGAHVVLTVGGTGVGTRDTTVDVLNEMIDRSLEGITDRMREYGLKRTPRAMVSRSCAGLVGDSLVIALPGSTRGATESMKALFPQVLQVVVSLRKDPERTC
ncbi:MAG: molybdenum cofactor biosynthesis protein MoaC [Bradymonadia bacterium]|jgi:molybdenum cofactor biosynthesis protein MoaC